MQSFRKKRRTRIYLNRESSVDTRCHKMVNFLIFFERLAIKFGMSLSIETGSCIANDVFITRHNEKPFRGVSLFREDKQKSYFLFDQE
jgi:hypothetical protein